MQDPELMRRSRAIEDPKNALLLLPIGSAAIKERVVDNDPLEGFTKVTWLRCGDLAEARAYIEQAGAEFAQPGPGEQDGVYTTREAFTYQPDTTQEGIQ